MKLTSPAFEHGGVIPKKYGLDFENVNPPLLIDDVPDKTAALVLIMDDPDVPKVAGVPVWDHWVVFNIPPETREICEAWSPKGVCGTGTRGELCYTGPRPPDREHRYFFKCYALRERLNLKEGSTKYEVLNAMADLILDSCELMGRFAPSSAN